MLACQLHFFYKAMFGVHDIISEENYTKTKLQRNVRQMSIKSVLQIRSGNRAIFGIISHISPQKHIL